MAIDGSERRVNGPATIHSVTEEAVLARVPGQHFSRRRASGIKRTVWTGMEKSSIRPRPNPQQLTWEAAGSLRRLGPNPPTSGT